MVFIITSQQTDDMPTRKIHYVSGLIIVLFVALHLFNHICSTISIEKHIAVMHFLRHIYRNIFVEIILLMAVFVQLISGLRLFIANRKLATTGFEKLHIWTGLYLAIFFVIHVGAVLTGRFLLHLDTNVYFGVAGLNTFPLNLFFVPYYGLAIISFFGHLASIHGKKMRLTLLGVTPLIQSQLVLIFGIFLTVLIFYGLTDHFRGVRIPEAYKVLTGK